MYFVTGQSKHSVISNVSRERYDNFKAKARRIKGAAGARVEKDLGPSRGWGGCVCVCGGGGGPNTLFPVTTQRNSPSKLWTWTLTSNALLYVVHCYSMHCSGLSFSVDTYRVYITLRKMKVFMCRLIPAALCATI